MTIVCSSCTSVVFHRRCCSFMQRLHQGGGGAGTAFSRDPKLTTAANLPSRQTLWPAPLATLPASHAHSSRTRYWRLQGVWLRRSMASWAPSSSENLAEKRASINSGLG